MADAEHVERMQQLLSRMMMMEGGGDGGPRGRSRQQMQTVLKSISNEADDAEQFQGLSELCNNLNMATEEILSAIRPEQFVPAVVACLRKEYNAELMLLAARCLTYMVDAIPASVIALSSGDGVELLLARLREITDVELAEQCLTCIDKVAAEAPAVVLQHQGISALLGYVDFFGIAVQRRAWSCVANLCKRLKAGQFTSMVVPSLPAIRANFRHEDSRIAEQALLAMNRIISSVAQEPKLAMEAFGDAADALIEIIEKRSFDSIFSNALALTSTAATASAGVAECLIEIGTVASLTSLLQGGLNPNVTPSHASGAPATSPQLSFAPSPNQPPTAASAYPDTVSSPLGAGRATPPSGLSGQVTPPAATPPRGPSSLADSSSAASASRQKPVRPEHTKDAVSALVGLLPRVNEDYMVYSHILAGMNLSSDTAAAGTSVLDGSDLPRGYGQRVGGTDDDENDDFAEEDEDGEEDEPTREDVEALVAEGVVRLSTKEEWRKCRLTHSCDGCGKRLIASDWFRCNHCRDYDMCLKCFVNMPGQHDESHDFTDMSVVLPGGTSAEEESVAAAATRTAMQQAAAAGLLRRVQASEAAGSSDAENPLAEGSAAASTSCPRAEMLRRSPYLLQRIAEALPTIVRLRRDSEHPRIRNLCLVFITRCVHYATAEDLRIFLADAPLCEVISSAISDPELLTQLQCVHISRGLLTKLPDIYLSLFAREGVTNALALLKSTASAPETTARLEQLPLKDLCATEAGWRFIVSSQASKLLQLFVSVEDTKMLEQLQEISQLFVNCKQQEQHHRGGDGFASVTAMADACNRLNALLNHVSTFELMSSTVVRDLVQALRDSEDPVTHVMMLASILSSSAGSGSDAGAGLPPFEGATTTTTGSGGAGNFARFVRHLQSIVSQAEKFKPPSFGDVSSVNSQIRLNVVPHKQSAPPATEKRPDAMMGGKPSRAATKKPRGPPSTQQDGGPEEAALGREDLPPRKKQRGGNRKGGSQQPAPHAEEASVEASSSSPSAPPAPPTPSTEGKSAHVSIEPLASISGVIDFIQTNLLPSSPSAAGGDRRGSSHSNSGGGGGGEDGDVEEILPNHDEALDLGSVVAAAMSIGTDEATRKKARKESSPSVRPPVYVRFGNRALPPNISMLQVLQRYNTSSNTSKGSGDDQRNSELRRQLQQHGIPAELFLSGGLEPITLHYSLHPWGSDVLPQEAHPAQPVGNPQDALTLVNDENCFTDGATRVASAVHLKFDFSNKHVPVQLRDPLTLLAVLHAAATNWPSLLQWQSLRRGAGSRQDASTEEPLQLQPPNISHSEFVNLKLNNKAMRHCSSLLLAGQHTATWAVMLALDCGYLFTPQTRMFLFEVSFFGTARSLTRMQEVLSEDAGGVGDTTSSSSSAANAQRRHTRLHRKKLRVWRDCPLSSAIAILSKHHASGDVLEMEFYGEPGSGLGPTLEFFTLTGASIREMKHQLWRRSGEESEADKHYSSPLGLYPRPLPPNSPEANRLAPYFRFIGQLLARGLIDKRQLNLRLSPPLLKLLRGDVMTIDDVAYINDGLYRVLRAILIAVRHGVNSLELGGKAPCTVEDLCLTFVCPGADDIELVKGGSDISVTFENAEQYVRAVVGFMLKTGVERFARELRLGFHACLPLYSLRAVQLDELGAYINGHEAPVTMQDLEAHVHVDHGFTASSPAVRFLFEVIASKPVDAQRRFFQFLTGSPHLPMGGLQMLRPRFTVVRKTSTDPKVPEQDQLPSSMTCQNYLKLPAYETKDLLCRKLELAVEEGCGAFLFT